MYSCKLFNPHSFILQLAFLRHLAIWCWCCSRLWLWCWYKDIQITLTNVCADCLNQVHFITHSLLYQNTLYNNNNINTDIIILKLQVNQRMYKHSTPIKTRVKSNTWRVVMPIFSVISRLRSRDITTSERSCGVELRCRWSSYAGNYGDHQHVDFLTLFVANIYVITGPIHINQKLAGWTFVIRNYLG